MSLGRIVTYSEDQGGGYPPIMYSAKAMDARASGGTMAEAAPSVPTGENTITSNVSIVYELR